MPFRTVTVFMTYVSHCLISFDEKDAKKRRQKSKSNFCAQHRTLDIITHAKFF